MALLMSMHIKAFHALSVCKEKLILHPGKRKKHAKKSKFYLGIQIQMNTHSQIGYKEIYPFRKAGLER